MDAVNMNSTPIIPFEALQAKLGPNDDQALWKTAASVLSDEFWQRHQKESGKRDWVLVVGLCSHWERPNQHRWTAAGGFAWPTGYSDFLPEFDWSVIYLLRNQSWTPLTKLPGKKLRTLRAAIPARTARHKQAAIHTRWFPGRETVFYGFRNLGGKWSCVAASDRRKNGQVLTNS
jgi:hypothetical protein